MDERREAHFHRLAEFLRLVDHQHRVQAGVDLRMPPDRLRRAEKPVDFREHDAQRAAGPQCFEEQARVGSGECRLRLFPDAVGHQCIGLALGDHLSHQVARLGGDAKAEVGEPCGEPGDAQDAHRVFDERSGDVAEQSPADVGHTTERIDQLPGSVPRQRVDRQVPPAQVVLDRHLG